MNHFTLRNLFVLLFTILNLNLFSQNVFKANELIQPKNLAEKITEIQAKRPLILNVGVEKNIKYAI